MALGQSCNQIRALMRVHNKYQFSAFLYQTTDIQAC